MVALQLVADCGDQFCMAADGLAWDIVGGHSACNVGYSSAKSLGLWCCNVVICGGQVLLFVRFVSMLQSDQL